MSLFKKVKRKNIRQKQEDETVESNSEDEDTNSFIDDLKEVQKLRRRQHGINVEDLGAVHAPEKSSDVKKDPFKMETGGYIDMKKMKEAEEVEEQIGTAFASETNRRDEDTEMLKYVEIEMKKRKGLLNEDEIKSKHQSAEDKLYELPENLKNIKGRKNKKEDMISNQMLSGIPEVDLGIETKIKNIEQTEEAKQKMIFEKNRKNEAVSDFVPTNYAVNFVQHNRFNIEDNSAALKRKFVREEVPTPVPLRVGDVERIQTGQEQVKQKKVATEKATDDFHFEKFRKHMRKY